MSLSRQPLRKLLHSLEDWCIMVLLKRSLQLLKHFSSWHILLYKKTYSSVRKWPNMVDQDFQDALHKQKKHLKVSFKEVECQVLLRNSVIILGLGRHLKLSQVWSTSGSMLTRACYAPQGQGCAKLTRNSISARLTPPLSNKRNENPFPCKNWVNCSLNSTPHSRRY